MKQFLAAFTTLCLLACSSLTTVSAQETQANKIKEGKTILEKWIAAQGGRDRISKIGDMTLSSTINLTAQGLNGSLDLYIKDPNKIRQDVKVMGMTITQAFNGSKGWMTNPQSGLVEEMPAVLQAELKRQAMDSRYLIEADKYGITFTLEGRATIDGKEYIILKQTYSDGYIANHYLDPATYLEFKSVAKSLGQNGNQVGMVERESILSDYRDIQGMKVPFSITINQNGGEFLKLTITEYKINSGLKDSLFDQ